MTIAPQAPMTHHLVFADDCILCKAKNDEMEALKSVLEWYCEAFGQHINVDKSMVYFVKACQELARNEIKGILKVQNETLNEKNIWGYLQIWGAQKWCFQLSKRPYMEEGSMME